MIQEITASKFLAWMDDDSGLTAGEGEGQFKFPHGVAVSPEGEVVVSEAENDRIQVFGHM